METCTQEYNSVGEEMTSLWCPEGQISYTGEGRRSGWEGDLDSLSGGGSRCHVQRLISVTGHRAPE